MTTLYTLSTLNEYTWTVFYLDKPVYLSYVAVSKTQAVSGLTTLLEQIENTRRYVEKLRATISDPDELAKKVLELKNSISVNFHIRFDDFQYSYDTIVTNSIGQQTTIGEHVYKTEPSVTRFRLGTIRDY